MLLQVELQLYKNQLILCIDLVSCKSAELYHSISVLGGILKMFYIQDK